ncbi:MULTISPECIES: pyridoxal-phosphate dependent enzyme [Streptomyces]|uniref:pyridoxal-phosphate dependent enzyme n=1 Tax=Streptomyces TaxID=1883 RepID=UPI002E3124FF|nr:pyridoxal-phosphate dependent enzyme [Streptomyces sp. NBC_01685]
MRRCGRPLVPSGRAPVGSRPCRALAERLGSHFLDHFADAGRAMAVCGEPTVADEIFAQPAGERPPVPEWIAPGTGTGATSASVGRHLRGHGRETRLAVVDPENSAYFPAWASGCDDYTTGMPSRTPGIGRPRTEPGFLPEVIDLMIAVAPHRCRDRCRSVDRDPLLGNVPPGGTDARSGRTRQRRHRPRR